MKSSTEVEAKLRAALKAFLASNAPDPLDLRKIAAARQVLPVLRGWEALGAVRLDGTPVEVSYEPPYRISEVKERAMVLGLLGHCAAKFPDLAELRPARPADARKYPLCGGTRRTKTPSDDICLCAGLGWLVPASGAV